MSRLALWRWVVFRQRTELDHVEGRPRQVDDLPRQGRDGHLDRLPRLIGPVKSSGEAHQLDDSIDQVPPVWLPPPAIVAAGFRTMKLDNRLSFDACVRWC